MTIRLRTAFFIGIGIFFIWILYLARGILPPFILAAIFAYIFNPTVNFFSKKIKIPRVISVIIVYLILISIIIALGILLSQRIFTESSEITNYINYLLNTTRSQISTLPDWLQPTVYDFLFSLRKTPGVSGSFSLVPFFPKAISEVTSFIIFIFSSFYLLKDGDMFIHKFLTFVPKDLKLDVEILIRKINKVLGGYLRGEIFLVFLMALWTYLALTILGVRFALVIGIFSGFAEIVPVIGPIVAAAVACFVVLLTGNTHFFLSPFNAVIIVILIYFVLRHIEDYFIIPHVMGKITKLPPFVIFFAVIIGGHLWGILGLVLAVPIAAILRIFLEFFMDRINRGLLEENTSGSE